MTDTKEIPQTNWIDEEEQTLSNPPEFEKLPAMKFEQNKMAKIKIDISTPFQKWSTTNQQGKPVTKAIMPVIHEGVKKNWWLNVKNPSYGEIIRALKANQTEFSILQTGTQADTKYVIVK